jgi:hypothetical protein
MTDSCSDTEKPRGIGPGTVRSLKTGSLPTKLAMTEY